MERLMEKLMAHQYWDLLRMEDGGNRFVRAFARADEFQKNEFLTLVMMGFYPLSAAILLAFRQIERLAPNEEVQSRAHFFVEVEEGIYAASSWYRGVHHAELYRRMFSSLSPAGLVVHEEMLLQYLGALDLEQGGLPRAIVTAGFIEKTGRDVLNLLHDFVAQWQTFSGRSTTMVDLTYLNEHLLHEGDASPDQHVAIIDELIAGCGAMELEQEIAHFEMVTDRWFTHIYERVLMIGVLCPQAPVSERKGERYAV